MIKIKKTINNIVVCIFDNNYFQLLTESKKYNVGFYHQFYDATLTDCLLTYENKQINKIDHFVTSVKLPIIFHKNFTIYLQGDYFGYTSRDIGYYISSNTTNTITKINLFKYKKFIIQRYVHVIRNYYRQNVKIAEEFFINSDYITW